MCGSEYTALMHYEHEHELDLRTRKPGISRHSAERHDPRRIPPKRTSFRLKALVFIGIMASAAFVLGGVAALYK